MLFLNSLPNGGRRLPYSPLGYQLARHRSEHVVIVFDPLKALIREFPFHGQRDE